MHTLLLNVKFKPMYFYVLHKIRPCNGKIHLTFELYIVFKETKNKNSNQFFDNVNKNTLKIKLKF